ncbi:hypothetical protein OC842_006607 [Tilletia horrida]|uniref:alpha-1,2-Mannosidase n=1 Tax=Tilletia horrida TaxID=155126 RepID=A0AAN6G5H9_9BASI|nr:hypothetical protein OC842_006607 [Tilletia horrida]
MRVAITSALALAIFGQLGGAVTLQSPNLKANATRADAVRALYQSSFANYLKYAKGADELLPLSKKPQNNFLGGWGATMVDSISTSRFMNLTDYATLAEDWMINNVDYTKTAEKSISLFETTIRHVAGLVSAYELGGQTKKGLIKQATILADILLRAWNGTDVPYNTLVNWGPTTARPDDSSKTASAGIAEAGTLILEFDRLSKYSGNASYKAFARRAEDALVRSRGQFPGLRYQEYFTHYLNGSRQLTPNTTFTSLGGGSDSFYEYLLKYPLLLGNTKSSYLGTWVTGTKSAIKYLVQSPRGHDSTFFLADADARTILPEYSHLACYAPGNILLGGKALGNDQLVQWGLKLAQGCIDTYRATGSGIGPEQWTYILKDGSTNGVSYTDDAFSQQHGFSISSADYVLRPEVLESMFYAYRITGDQRWADYAWDAFLAIQAHYTTPDGSLAATKDVRPSNPKLIDNEQSFVYAETFKYLYMTFADPSIGSLDRYVFNTEAHPFLRENAGADFTTVTVGTVPTPLMQSHV